MLVLIFVKSICIIFVLQQKYFAPLHVRNNILIQIGHFMQGAGDHPEGKLWGTSTATKNPPLVLEGIENKVDLLI